MTIKVQSSAQQYSLYMRQRADRLTPQVMLAMRATGVVAVRRARELSSGPYSLKRLRRMNHPYRRPPHGIGAARPEVINVQSGRFREEWRMVNWTSPGQKSGYGITVKLENRAPHARYMGGTKRMVHRPIMRAIVQTVMPEQRKNVRHALKVSLGSPFQGSATAGVSQFAANVAAGFRQGYGLMAGM